jgi:hypothetical protein
MVKPMKNKSQKTGRGFWDVVGDAILKIIEGGRPLQWIALVGWLLIIGVGAGWYRGWFSLQVNGSNSQVTEGSPFVHTDVVLADISRSQCEDFASDALERAGPGKLERPDAEQGGSTRFSDFGAITGWVSCIDVGNRVLIYIGGAGSSSGEAKNKRSQIRDFIDLRLNGKSN